MKQLKVTVVPIRDCYLGLEGFGPCILTYSAVVINSTITLPVK
jgi:hypothetical protein